MSIEAHLPWLAWWVMLPTPTPMRLAALSTLVRGVFFVFEYSPAVAGMVGHAAHPHAHEAGAIQPTLRRLPTPAPQAPPFAGGRAAASGGLRCRASLLLVCSM